MLLESNHILINLEKTEILNEELKVQQINKNQRKVKVKSLIPKNIERIINRNKEV